MAELEFELVSVRSKMCALSLSGLDKTDKEKTETSSLCVIMLGIDQPSPGIRVYWGWKRTPTLCL